jgi:2',3'-cyclic-nucleotide 2'-phosphodiesterase (5'-nucleotidase family)
MQRHFLLFILVISTSFWSCKTRYYALYEHPASYKVNAKSLDSIKFSETYNNNKTSLQYYLAPLHASLENTMNAVLGNATSIFKKDKIENALGYLITDAMLDNALKINPKTTISIYNYGGIRANQLNEGSITLGEIFEILPFENTIAFVTIKGTELKKWCDLIAKKGGWPVTGLSFYIKNEMAIRLGNIDDNTEYTIVTNDYIAAGNDGCDFLKATKPQLNAQTIRDVVINYIKEKKTISPDNTRRIFVEK